MDATEIYVLKGFICASETRNLENGDKNTIQQKNLILICRRFWHDKPIVAFSDNNNHFNYEENFSTINDEQFLKRMEKQYLNLELWQLSKKMIADNNIVESIDNLQTEALLLGVAHVPLHPLFTAFHNVNKTDRMCNESLPIISIDGWTSIRNDKNNGIIGEIRCFLAMGTDNQIKNLKLSKGFNVNLTSEINNRNLVNQSTCKISQSAQTTPVSATVESMDTTLTTTTSSVKQTSDLLNMFQKALSTQCTTLTLPSDASITANSLILKPLKQIHVKLFKFVLEIQKATNLPLNPPAKLGKNGMSKQHISKRFPPNEQPSCYVTFQADEGQYPLYKSFEGTVYATKIITKCTQPEWQQRFRLAASIDYLQNQQKRFILKVWKKSLNDSSNETLLQPTPMEDAIVGFAALDLTVFSKGLDISGCFNIVDFNGRINGQLSVRCHPSDDVKCFLNYNNNDNASYGTECAVDSIIDQFEESFDLTHLRLNQAIKRKFNELENISQRLRARLGDIAGTTLPVEFNYSTLDKWQKMKDDEQNDNRAIYEFQQYLNPPFKINDNNEDHNEKCKTNKNMYYEKSEEIEDKLITSGNLTSENIDSNE